MEKKNSHTSSRPAAWAWILSLVTALIWVIVAAAYAVRPWQSIPDQPLLRWAFSLAMLVIAVGVVWLGNGLRKQQKTYYFLALIFLGANIVMIFFDDFGLSDLTYLLYVIVLLALLLINRKSLIGAEQK